MDQRGLLEGNLVEASLVIPATLTLGIFFIIMFQLTRKRVKVKAANGRNGEVDHGIPGLEAIPGPKSWDPTGIIGNVFQILPLETSMDTIQKWGESFGPIFKYVILRQTYVWLDSAPAAQSLLKSTNMGHFPKAPAVYDSMKPFLQNGILISAGKLWQTERRILLKSQSYQNLKAYIPMLNKHCEIFVANLKKLFEDGEAHEINDLISSSFIKVISEMVTGIDHDHTVAQYHENYETWTKCMAYMVTHPWSIFRPLWKLHPMSWKHDKAVREMCKFAKRKIRERKLQQRTSVNDIEHIGKDTEDGKLRFRSALEDLIDEGVDESQIVDEINTLLFEGHDTGATTIHFFLFCMALHPEIQKECQKEVDELFTDPSSYKDGALTFEAISGSLKLVERCILETLRLFPPVFAYSRKLETPLKINSNGQDILLPSGTVAAVSPFTLHRKSGYFPNPEVFDPDRFLPEECAKRHSYAYLPFSAGPRACLGMKFAMIEMKIIAGYTLRHFSITTSDRMEDFPVLPFMITTSAKNYSFKFIQRN